jgi:hypothetical protein
MPYGKEKSYCNHGLQTGLEVQECPVFGDIFAMWSKN